MKKVLIVGAGPTGLTAALEFARNGIKPEIVDAKEEPSKLSRAVGILPRSIEILDRTGVGERIAREGIQPEQITICRGNKPFLEIDFSEFSNKERLISLPQDRTESLMSEKLVEMGVTVQYNTKVLSVENGSDDVVVSFEGGETRTYDWVIGADGVNSTVRRSLGIEFQGYELEEDWSIADVEIKSNYNEKEFKGWLLKNDREERDMALMVPIQKDRVRLISSTPDSIKALPIDLDVREIRRSGTFKISIRQAERYVEKRVLLAGDAAHAHSPVGGRGMNLGIEDAALAVEAVLNSTTEEYERSRRIKAGQVIKWTEFARKNLVSKNPFINLLMTALSWLLRNSKTIRRKFIERVLTS